MTGPGSPQRGSPVPPRAPQSGGRPAEADEEQHATLAPREEQQLEDSVRVVGRTGRGPAIVGILVIAAFLLGLARPWDLLGDAGPAPDGVPPLAPAASVLTGSTAAAGDPDGAPPDAAVRTPPAAPTRALTCAFPSEWRSASIEDWSGRPARVWRAADVVPADGPADPAIPFEPIVANTITAIGWCAPVDGPERPPLALTASLFRIRDGVAAQIEYDRLEPAEPDALGELWTPVPLGVGNRPSWPFGRYVIELRSAGGTYVRYLGVELLEHVEPGGQAGPSPSAGAPSPGGSPEGSPGLSPSGSPDPSPLGSPASSPEA